MADNARLSAIVHGVVQGVGFRYFVRRHARNLGLTGYTRNMNTGNEVEVVAEGDRANLEQLLSLLHQGPPESDVTDVRHSWQSFEGNASNFEIRH